MLYAREYERESNHTQHQKTRLYMLFLQPLVDVTPPKTLIVFPLSPLTHVLVSGYCFTSIISTHKLHACVSPPYLEFYSCTTSHSPGSKVYRTFDGHVVLRMGVIM